VISPRHIEKVLAGEGDDLVAVQSAWSVDLGDGDDGLFATDLVAFVVGGAGDDAVTVGSTYLAELGDGDDTFKACGYSAVYGGDGNDVMRLEGGGVALGGAGDDHIEVGGASGWLLGEDGDDTAVIAAPPDGSGAFRFDGGAGRDTVRIELGEAPSALDTLEIMHDVWQIAGNGGNGTIDPLGVTLANVERIEVFVGDALMIGFEVEPLA